VSINIAHSQKISKALSTSGQYFTISMSSADASLRWDLVLGHKDWLAANSRSVDTEQQNTDDKNFSDDITGKYIVQIWFKLIFMQHN